MVNVYHVQRHVNPVLTVRYVIVALMDISVSFARKFVLKLASSALQIVPALHAQRAGQEKLASAAAIASKQEKSLNGVVKTERV